MVTNYLNTGMTPPSLLFIYFISNLSPPHYLLTVLGISSESKVFWCERIKARILRQFEFGLFTEELDTEYDLSTSLAIPELVIVILLPLV